jgi:hypothetical protein
METESPLSTSGSVTNYDSELNLSVWSEKIWAADGRDAVSAHCLHGVRNRDWMTL